jgi:hypothetical protein
MQFAGWPILAKQGCGLRFPQTTSCLSHTELESGKEEKA